MLRKIPEIEQPFVPYNEQYNACFINHDDGFMPLIAPGVVVNGLIDCTGQVTLERDVFTGHSISILTGGHDYDKFGEERKTAGIVKSVHVKEGAWLGSFCIILPGVTIGEHSVVGAGAVVTKSVDSYTVVAGNPAIPIKKYNHETKQWEKINEKRSENANGVKTENVAG